MGLESHFNILRYFIFSVHINHNNKTVNSIVYNNKRSINNIWVENNIIIIKKYS